MTKRDLGNEWRCDYCGRTATGDVFPFELEWVEVRPIAGLLRDEDDPESKHFCSRYCLAKAYAGYLG